MKQSQAHLQHKERAETEEASRRIRKPGRTQLHEPELLSLVSGGTQDLPC